ncbi:hypothetical protein RvY_07753 [Ramazzottius varieornatus]|uniref:Piezo TM1-24 domain-containing protein n=1 Tax=Ramazzottius varieornatus TaxID=947166 RepID=A0A1D1V6A4_RAMVA|nr:hypothetical protein RvY_07753 [Ramazzottius varieornatus]
MPSCVWATVTEQSACGHPTFPNHSRHKAFFTPIVRIACLSRINLGSDRNGVYRLGDLFLGRLAPVTPSQPGPVTNSALQGTVTIEPPSPHSESSLHKYRVRMVLQYLTRVVAKQSYIISLIAMMAWSVIYYSWLTLYSLYKEIVLTAKCIYSPGL